MGLRPPSRATRSKVWLRSNSGSRRPGRRSKCGPPLTRWCETFDASEAGQRDAEVLAVQVRSLDGVPILGPLPLDMDQRTLPLAEQQVLERGERQEVVFGEHPVHRISISFTPGGTRSRWTVTS